MTATPTTTAPELSPEEQRAKDVLNLSMRMLGVDDGDMHERTGMSRSSIQGKRSGRSPIRIGKHTRLYAEALNVPPELFLMEPLDAGLWLLEHRTEQVIDASGWVSGFPAQASLFDIFAA